MTAVFGEFRCLAAEHIAAAVSYRGALPYDAQRGVVVQLDRLTKTFQRYLADLPQPDALDPVQEPERNPAAPTSVAVLALNRATQILNPAAAVLTLDADDDDIQPAVAHLTAAADSLAAGRDLLRTHVTLDPHGFQAANSYWAPAIASRQVTATLLDELGSYTQALALWVARLSGMRSPDPGPPTSAQLALRAAQPWLELAGAAMHAAPADYPPPNRMLLDAIPANAPPPRLLPGHNQTVAELCQAIPFTAERLRYAAFTFAARARWSPAATSASWRRNSLASAITTHASELILRLLADRASDIGLEPAFRAQLSATADGMGQACRSWLAITSHWDILTTGTARSSGTTPVAAEIQDLVVQTGRLAYRNPHWTPAAADASPPRDPATLTRSPSDAIAVLTAIHQATDALGHIAAEDHQAVLTAADDNRLYVPVRLLPDEYDIPHPYTRALRPYLDALAATYDSAINAVTGITTVLDDLASAANAPSSVLSLARRASVPTHQDLRYLAAPQPRTTTGTPGPGHTKRTPLNLQIRDPAVIDQAAQNVLTAATDNADSRHDVTPPARSSAPRPRQGANEPARTASQEGYRQPLARPPDKRHPRYPDAVRSNRAAVKGSATRLPSR